MLHKKKYFRHYKIATAVWRTTLTHNTLLHFLNKPVYNSAFTNYCTYYYIFNRHNITIYAYVIMTHAFGPPLLSSCYWQLLPYRMAVTPDQSSVANTHACNRKTNTLQWMCSSQGLNWVWYVWADQDMLWCRIVLHRMVYEQGCSMLTCFKTMRKYWHSYMRVDRWKVTSTAQSVTTWDHAGMKAKLTISLVV